jgi:hypothetical protein
MSGHENRKRHRIRDRLSEADLESRTRERLCTLAFSVASRDQKSAG